MHTYVSRFLEKIMLLKKKLLYVHHTCRFALGGSSLYTVHVHTQMLLCRDARPPNDPGKIYQRQLNIRLNCRLAIRNFLLEQSINFPLTVLIV